MTGNAEQFSADQATQLLGNQALRRYTCLDRRGPASKLRSDSDINIAISTATPELLFGSQPGFGPYRAPDGPGGS